MSDFANPLVQVFHHPTAANPLQAELSTARDASDTLQAFPLDTASHPLLPGLLEQAQRYLSDHAMSLIANPYQADPLQIRQAIADAVLSLNASQEIAVQITERLEAQLLGAGLLEPFMRDPEISEIMVTGREIYVDAHGVIQHAYTLPSLAETIRLAQHIARHCRREYRETEPLMDLTWPENGARINITHHRIAVTGPAITIRKHNMGVLLQLDELIDRRMISAETADFVVRLIQQKANVLVMGPTRSGKTALLRALAIAGIPYTERLIVLEDTEELRLPHPHQINLIGRSRAVTPEERAQGQVSLLDLFRNALRQSPDRIIMGELRGPEAFDFIETGLTEPGGSLTTVHIRQPEYLVTRLYWIAKKSNLDIPPDLLFRSVHEAIDCMIQVSRDNQTGFRWVSRISEPLPDGRLNDLFAWNAATQTLDRVHAPTDKLADRLQ